MPSQPLRRSPRLAARASKVHAPKFTPGILRVSKAASRGASKPPTRVKFGRNAVAEFEEENPPDELEPLSDEVAELLFPHNVVSKPVMGNGQTKRNEEALAKWEELYEDRDCSDEAIRGASKSPTRVNFGRNSVAEFEKENMPDELEPLGDEEAEQLFPHNVVSKSTMADGRTKSNEETLAKWDALFEDRDCSDEESCGASKSPTRVKFGRNAVAEFEEDNSPDELEPLGDEEAEQLFPHNVVSTSAMSDGQTKRNEEILAKWDALSEDRDCSDGARYGGSKSPMRVKFGRNDVVEFEKESPNELKQVSEQDAEQLFSHNVVSKSAFDDGQTKRNEETLEKWDGLFEDWDYSDGSSADSDDSTGGPEPSGLRYVVAEQKEIDYSAISSPGTNVCQPRGETNRMPTTRVDVCFCDFCKRGVRRTTEYFYE